MTAKRRHPITPVTWQADAACLGWPDPDDFFPDRGDESPAVLRVCLSCPVLRACGEQALGDRERYGIWGGMTERDRERWWEQARRLRSAAAERRGA